MIAERWRVMDLKPPRRQFQGEIKENHSLRKSMKTQWKSDSTIIFSAYTRRGVWSLTEIVGPDATLDSITNEEHNSMVEQIIAHAWRLV